MLHATSSASALVLACAVALLFSATAGAQTNERTYESLGVRVVTPGARAVAMGKTFVGIADDATAAASNPAGLSNLLDPEVTFEWSAVDIHHSRMITANPLTTGTFSQLVTFPSFASFVTPMPDVRALRNVTLAVFYDSLQRYEEHFDIPNRVAGDTTTTEGGYRGDINIRARTIGLGGAVLLSRKISLGGSLTWLHLKNDTESFEYVGADNPRVNNGSLTHDSDAGMAGQFGVLVKPMSGLSIGAAYYSGTTFHRSTTLFGLFSPENSPPALPQPVEIFTDPVQPIEYRIPDRFTVGVAVRPRSDLTLVSDAGVVRYSQRITPDFLIVDFLGQPSAKLKREDYDPFGKPYPYVIDNVVELHAGAEYRRVVGGRVFALRGGVFTEPNHQMRFDYERSYKTPQADGQRIRFDSYIPGTVVSVTGGAGFVLGNRFQFDGAFTFSSNARELVLSSVVRFPR